MIRFIKLETVKATTGLSKSSIYAAMKEGNFPSNVVIGPRAVAWIESDIQQWMEDKIKLRGL